MAESDRSSRRAPSARRKLLLVLIAFFLAALSVATWRYVDFRITQNRLLSTEGFPNNCEGDQAQYCETPVDTALVCLGDSERVCDMIRAAFEADGRFRLMSDSSYTARKTPKERDEKWIEVIIDFELIKKYSRLKYIYCAVKPRNIDASHYGYGYSPEIEGVGWNTRELAREAAKYIKLGEQK